MRSRHLSLLLIVSTVFVVGCGSSNKGKIEGTRWVSAGAGIPRNLEFRKNGALTYKVGETTYTGTYEVGGGDKVTFKLEQDFQGGGKVHVKRITIREEDLEGPDGTAGGKELVLRLVHDDGKQEEFRVDKK